MKGKSWGSSIRELLSEWASAVDIAFKATVSSPELFLLAWMVSLSAGFRELVGRAVEMASEALKHLQIGDVMSHVAVSIAFMALGLLVILVIAIVTWLISAIYRGALLERIFRDLESRSWSEALKPVNMLTILREGFHSGRRSLKAFLVNDVLYVVLMLALFLLLLLAGGLLALIYLGVRGLSEELSVLALLIAIIVGLVLLALWMLCFIGLGLAAFFNQYLIRADESLYSEGLFTLLKKCIINYIKLFREVITSGKVMIGLIGTGLILMAVGGALSLLLGGVFLIFLIPAGILLSLGEGNIALIIMGALVLLILVIAFILVSSVFSGFISVFNYKFWYEYYMRDKLGIQWEVEADAG